MAPSKSCGPARKTSNTTCIDPIGSIDCPRVSTAEECRSPGTIASGVLRSSRDGSLRGSTTASTRHHRGRDRSRLRSPEHARRVCARGASGHSDRFLAQRRAIAQCFRDRKLHGRTGGGGKAGCGRLSARAARQVAARQGRPRPRGGQSRLGTPKESDAASHFSSSLDPTWPMLPKSK